MRMTAAGGLEGDKSCKNLDLNNGYNNNLDSNTNCASLDSINGDDNNSVVEPNKKLSDLDSNCDTKAELPPPEYGSRLAQFLQTNKKVALLLDFDGTLRCGSGTLTNIEYQRS